TFKVGWQYFSRLQIRHLARGKPNQLADTFMESGRRAEPEQIRDFRTGVGFEIIPVTELVMRGEKPARVRFDALERTNVVLKIDMPARSVRVFLPLRIRWQRIKIRFLPKTFRQRRKPESGIELFGRFDNPFRLT